jgi:SAM-dependent methyltransferase
MDLDDRPVAAIMPHALAEDQTGMSQRQRRRGEYLAAYFDSLADNWDRCRRRNAYYHRSRYALFRAHVPEGSSVLEVGCATGELLNLLQPAYGLGMDLSPRMVARARRTHPRLEFQEADGVFFDTARRFDFVVLDGVLEYIVDIQGLLRNCRRLLKPRGRILLSTLNPLWNPVLRLGARLGLRNPDTERNFLTGLDAANLLQVSGLEVVKFMRRTLVPWNVPLLAPLLNLVAAQTPGVRRLCATAFLVARPRPQARDYSVSVVIPCYNEADNIESCVRRVPRMGCHTEVIVVDDGSEDGTAQRVRTDLNPAIEVRCLSHQPNRGKLHAVRAGCEHARGDIVMILDADMTVPPENLPCFYGPLADGVGDFINGTRLIYPRAKGSMKWQNLYGNKLFAKLVSWLTGVRFSDTLCGTKAFFKEDYQHYRLGDDPWGDFDLLFGAAQQASKILEVPIHYEERRAGLSKMKALRHSWDLLKACWHGFWRVKYPPSSLGRRPAAGEGERCQRR